MNEINDISALAHLINLTHLYLEGNQISDISVLKNLTNLTYLILSDNPISQSDIDWLKQQLPNCDIAYENDLNLDNNDLRLDLDDNIPL